MRPGLFLVAAVMLTAGMARADDDLVLDLGGEKLETRHIVHGTFVQGALVAEPGHDRDEEPAHQVTISRDFWMGKYPVTKGQFAKFVSDTRYVSDAEKGTGGAGWDGKALVPKRDFSWKNPGFTQTDEHPVVMVTYGDANAFVGWASRKTGKRVRLPTEAEWEYAARGGSTTPWYGAGTEAEAGALGWFKSNAGNGTRPVGQKKPNVLGLFDMAGNVFEWCRDIHAPYREGAVIDPEVTTNPGPEAERRVLRGGSWLRDVKRARSGARFRNAPGSRNADNGFRVVVTNEEVVGPVVGAATEFAPERPLTASGTSGGSSGGAGPAVTATSGPLAADGTRVDTTGRGADGFSWGLLLASPLAASSAVVAWMLLRRKRPARAAAPRAGAGPRSVAAAGATRVAAVSPSGNTTRATEDGFFVRAPNVAPGSRVRYECVVNGTKVIDDVPIACDETFIYTGSPPTLIRIVEVLSGLRRPRTPDRPLALPAPRSFDPGLVPPPPASSSPSPVDFEGFEPGLIPGPPSSPLGFDPGLIPPPPSSPSPRRGPPPPPPPSSRGVPPAPPSSRGVPPAPPSSRLVPPAPPSSRAGLPPAPPSSRPSARALAAPPASAASLASAPLSAGMRPSGPMPVAPRPLAVGLDPTDRESSPPMIVPEETTDTPRSTAGLTIPTPAAPPSSDAFLGNPRAY